MKSLLLLLCFFNCASAFGADYKIVSKAYYPAQSIPIARKVVADVKAYYSSGKKNSCIPQKDFEFDKEYIELILGKNITEVRVDYYSDVSILLSLSFRESDKVIALNVKLKNSECDEFILYKSEFWSDPV